MNTLKGQQMLMLDDGHCLRNQTLDYCLLQARKKTLTSKQPVLKPYAIWWRLMSGYYLYARTCGVK